MPEENYDTDDPPSSSSPVVPLPIALYVSGGLVFELYNGGQPACRFSISWERLKPTAAEARLCSQLS